MIPEVAPHRRPLVAKRLQEWATAIEQHGFGTALRERTCGAIGREEAAELNGAMAGLVPFMAAMLRREADKIEGR